MRNKHFDSISSAIILLVSIAYVLPAGNSFAAPDIVVPIAGCGTGCSIVQEQIGPPYEDKHGLRKVRVRQTFQMAPCCGEPSSSVVEEKYFLAECTKRKANFTSYSSNGSGQNDIFRWVDVPHDPELRHSGPNWGTFSSSIAYALSVCRQDSRMNTFSAISQ